MTAEFPDAEYPYLVKIETATGQSATVPIAFLTAKQIENFFQFDFKRLVQEAGMQGARIHVERAVTADYEKVLREVSRLSADSPHEGRVASRPPDGRASLGAPGVRLLIKVNYGVAIGHFWEVR